MGGGRDAGGRFEVHGRWVRVDRDWGQTGRCQLTDSRFTHCVITIWHSDQQWWKKHWSSWSVTMTTVSCHQCEIILEADPLIMKAGSFGRCHYFESRLTRSCHFFRFNPQLTMSSLWKSWQVFVVQYYNYIHRFSSLHRLRHLLLGDSASYPIHAKHAAANRQTWYMFVKSFTQDYTLYSRNLPEEIA